MEKLISTIQNELKQQGLDGWLFYDFHRSNTIAYNLLAIPTQTMITRRFFYFIPQVGKAQIIHHFMEAACFSHLPGDRRPYLSWQEYERHLEDVLRDSSVIAMEYSSANPYISKVDAGTMDLVRRHVSQVQSSEHLVSRCQKPWTQEQIDSHFFAAKVLDETVSLVWETIHSALKEGREIRESDIQNFILQEFDRKDCCTEDPPICAVNANSAQAHYLPTRGNDSAIRKGDFILIDLWCKRKRDMSIYADITRVAIADTQASSKHNEVFAVVKGARDATFSYLKEKIAKQQQVRGCDLDLVCRKFIEDAGYGPYFIHRTGHDIDCELHGPGTHLDSLEIIDTRCLLPGSCFSIEPGIYLEGEFGIRLEYDVCYDFNGDVSITGGEQKEIQLLG